MITFIHPPDFGIDFSQDGNRAKSVNGNAKAMANPNIPIAGATTLPVVDTCTSRKPIIGPVQEKDTNESVKAIRKILSNPVVDSALLSTAFPHFDGSLISNAPKNEAAKITVQNLLTVKSIVTIMLTVVFSYLAVVGRISGEQFLTIFSVVVAFYFGTQYQKGKEDTENGE